jgi:hypothetical protein
VTATSVPADFTSRDTVLAESPLAHALQAWQRFEQARRLRDFLAEEARAAAIAPPAAADGDAS